MAAIPQPADPTLVAADAALERLGNAEHARPYLGMSSIGRPCSRELWYGFRWCSPSTFDARTIKRFQDGHHGENVQAERLRMVDGVELLTVDPRTGKQFGFADHGGHFRGHMDGVIRGLLQAPRKWQPWEHKQVDEKKQTALEKAIETHGQKGALEAWDPTYYGQAVCYMHYADLDRHYLTCATPGGRRTISVRTNANPEKVRALIERARTIIVAASPPPKISDRQDWYECKFCQHQEVCHQDAAPKVNCRTCLHATPELDGDGRWTCARFGCDLSVSDQRQGADCPEHRYIPQLITFADLHDANDEHNWIDYRTPGGFVFRNGPGGYTSAEIRALGKSGLCPEVDTLKKPSAASPSNPSNDANPGEKNPFAAQIAATSSRAQPPRVSVRAPWEAKA